VDTGEELLLQGWGCCTVQSPLQEHDEKIADLLFPGLHGQSPAGREGCGFDLGHLLNNTLQRVRQDFDFLAAQIGLDRELLQPGLLLEHLLRIVDEALVLSGHIVGGDAWRRQRAGGFGAVVDWCGGHLNSPLYKWFPSLRLDARHFTSAEQNV